ncbi:cob(I)yrinic acid a,c-diamide adenosyltransferase [Ornithinimicrobium sp. INDO-MA30-4]|uniref:cob(I)yrinic acid a,c-diamide adenosyltransferase n=1 Tax=Ornithinimicrobium sp. INDO-MA30-4 TaxID=2908651 RepID=UPI001F40B45C|nr:cob(I)yrinic acid a,c-diamide adenosyltransferase [Ornithinimicrobium sp. INDO-MA30-4]UJH69970.1 cob(I)yrinic acid a,c-diamide adenosyltransferase [Ornithinimicrobium sp. INDO-MA30-4]
MSDEIADETTQDKDHDAPREKRPYNKRELRSASSLVLVNTGHGKGKSTAAFGTAMRSIARGWPTAVVQFIKSGKWHTGEEAMSKQLGIDWFVAGDGFSWESNDMDETKAKALAAWAFSKELINSDSHRMIVLDEISYPMSWGWIDPVEVAETLKNRPENVSVFLTGREMAAEVVEVANTVTEMTKIKHAFDEKIRARKGIDY